MVMIPNVQGRKTGAIPANVKVEFCLCGRVHRGVVKNGNHPHLLFVNINYEPTDNGCVKRDQIAWINLLRD